MHAPTQPTRDFFGWRVVAAAFVLAIFGWGLGFYGPPIYLHTVHAQRGWSVELISAAVTTHYLSGAVLVANLPHLYRRLGLPVVTAAGVAALVLGLLGWASAVQPWQLFLATLLSGAGWAAMGGAAINAIVAPWFVRLRPRALSLAYNGSSLGGVVFSPLWVFLIGRFGFRDAVLLVGGVAVGCVWLLAGVVFRHSPQSTGQPADGIVTVARSEAGPDRPHLPGPALWRDGRFRTLAAGMALGLFAQIGLLAHLFSLVVPALGETGAGFTVGLATLAAILGRTAMGWFLPAGADRRVAAALSYGVQMLGGVVLILSGGHAAPLIVAGAVLFGAGIGNATSLPPLIAQVEFASADALRAVALIVAISQAGYAFAPAAFGLVRDLCHPAFTEMAAVAAVATGVQALAMGAFLLGGRAGGRG
jgi:hypothetical protein